MSIRSWCEVALERARDFERWSPIVALLASLGSLFLPSAFGEGTKQIIAGTFFAAFLLAVIFRRRKPMVTPLSSQTDVATKQTCRTVQEISYTPDGKPGIGETRRVCAGTDGKITSMT